MTRKLLIAGACALALTSCSTVKELAGIEVNQQTIGVAVLAFDAAEVSAGKYTKLPDCTTGQTTGAAACKNPIIASLVKADVLKARAARDSLWAASKASPSGVGVTAAYQAFVAATGAIKTDLAKK